MNDPRNHTGTHLISTFDGAGLTQQDKIRLTGQLARVYGAMADYEWWTLPQLQVVCGGSEAGISARVRDLRKDRFGGHTIEKRRKRGLYQYRLVKEVKPQRDLF